MKDQKIYNNVNNSDDVSLRELLLKIKEFWQYLKSKFYLIICWCFLGALLGLAYSFIKKPVFTARYSFVLEDGGGSGAGVLGQYAGLASMVGFDVGGGGNGLFHGDNLLELYKSRSMLEKTLLSEVDYHGKKELLINVFIEFNKLRKHWEDKPSLKNINFPRNASVPLSRLQDSLISDISETINKSYLTVTKPDKKSSIIEVQLKSTDEVFSKAFADKIVSNVNDFYIQTKTKKSLDNVNILQHQTDSVRNVLNGAISTSATTLDATPNLNPNRQILRTQVQKSQFNAEANKAMLSELIKNLELSKLSLRKETPLIQIIDEPVYPLKKDKIGKGVAIVVGGLIAGFLTVVILFIHLFLRSILKSE